MKIKTKRRQSSRSPRNSGNSSTDSRISSSAIEHIVDKLKSEGVTKSTKQNYYCVWKNFNEFFIRLDKRPDSWEDRIILYTGFLIQEGKQSQTVRSYICALKRVLKEDGITINEDKFLISALTKACRLKHDRVKTRLPIQKGMLKILLKETETYYLIENSQPYLAKLYSALFSTAYFGLFRIGELTSGSHPILARDVHIARNKHKMLFILRSSKTHGLYATPQSVKITSKKSLETVLNEAVENNYCPYQILQDYLDVRPKYKKDDEPFFVFSDRTPVKPDNMRTTLKYFLEKGGFSQHLYSCHGFRSGRAVDLLSMKISVESIKKIGRWSSNAVFTYLKDF